MSNPRQPNSDEPTTHFGFQDVPESQKAEKVAENAKQRDVIKKLIQFYRDGDLKTFDEYAILWVKDLDSRIDFVNAINHPDFKSNLRKEFDPNKDVQLELELIIRVRGFSANDILHKAQRLIELMGLEKEWVFIKFNN